MKQPICRRCLSSRLLTLDKKRKEDNDIFRCRDCGYLFSPPPSSNGRPRAAPTESDHGTNR